MSRTSCDIYKMSDGTLIPVNQMTKPPLNSKLWQGYDYTNQYFVFNGKQDTRTLAELKVSMSLSK